jgi:hypothetical protein
VDEENIRKVLTKLEVAVRISIHRQILNSTTNTKNAQFEGRNQGACTGAFHEIRPPHKCGCATECGAASQHADLVSYIHYWEYNSFKKYLVILLNTLINSSL